jgi:hypothetical protein
MALAAGTFPNIVRMESIAPPKAEPVKHNWYDTRTELSLLVFVKDVHPEQLRVDLKPDSVHVVVDFVPPIELAVRLAKEIVPESPVISCTPMKVEIKMKKVPAAYGTWLTFELEG